MAGRGATLQKERCRFTPFDALISQLEADRRSTTSNREARKEDLDMVDYDCKKMEDTLQARTRHEAGL